MFHFLNTLLTGKKKNFKFKIEEMIVPLGLAFHNKETKAP
jgi:hypothetical protein